MSSLYNGSSKGFGIISDGYCDYGREIIAGRSFPDLRDGFKPVGRRCLYGVSNIKSNGLIKCGTAVGKIMEIHPHGDSSIYGALVSMTDNNGSYNVPMFKGNGELGHNYSSATPAAMRYTKCMLSVNAEDFLRDMDVCEMIPSEEGDGFEPAVFPVRYPVALINGTQGMAVSVSTMIPSFNFNDVLNLTIEYLKTGKMETVIAPDFPTGGILVMDNSELVKLMQTGKGKLKIRAKVEIEGKDILVKEIPFGMSIERIIKSIKDAEIKDIASAKEYTGSQSTSLAKITCKSKKSVESVLLQLYKYRILQSSISSNMIFVEGEEPVITGVYGIVERWCAWREKKVTEKFTKAINDLSTELTTLDYFIRLISNIEWRDTYMSKVVNVSVAEGKSYLHEIFEDIPETAVSWISDRKLSVFNRANTYAKRFADLTEIRKEYQDHLEHVDEYIISDLQDLLAKKGSQFPRRTELTYHDYRFSSVKNEEVEDDSVCCYTYYSTGFLKKTRTAADAENENKLFQIYAQANSTLIGFDCYGRIIRIYGTDIDFTGAGEHGEYLPKYVDADGFDGEYKIMYLGLLDGKKRMLVYRDGFVGFLDTSEFEGKKKVRTVQRGVDQNVYNMLLEVYEEDQFPEYLVVADEQANGKVRFGVTRVSEIREASRKSRAKVFGGNNIDIKYIAGMKYMDLLQFMEEPLYYVNRMRSLGNREVYGDVSTIMKEGRYYE